VFYHWRALPVGEIEPQIPQTNRLNSVILREEFRVENLVPNRIPAPIEIY
jgi:hypothetical protein